VLTCLADTRRSVAYSLRYKNLLSRARKQAKMSRGNQNPLRDIRTNESQSRFSDDVSKARTATEVVAALEQLSPKASLIRNARLNW
jgi:indole-3-glycerol phosphate synthase